MTDETTPVPQSPAPGTPPESTTPASGTLATESEGGSGPEIEPERLDADAVRVLLRLRQHRHEAYLVGGCVRDLLIGVEPKDFDICTSATPNQVRELFRNCRLIGRRFRLAHVYFKGGKILEVSTFRASPTLVDEPQPSEAAEGEVRSEGAEHIALADEEALSAVEEGKPVPETPVADVQDEVSASAPTPPPPAVEAPPPAPLPPPAGEPQLRKERDLLITEDNTFGTAIEDARRRDFTINGLFYDPMAGRVQDHVNGLRDLANREIRTIGDPEKRMREDPVRILRAVRFAGKLDFDIESRTYAAMEGAVEDLPRCAPPRVLEETFRLVRGGHASPALKLMLALDGMKYLLPPVDEYLRTQDKDGIAEYFALVDVMDAQVRGGHELDDSMLLACILMPLALEEPETPETDENARPNVAQAVESLLAELVQKARLPRRIAERCRMILLAQRTLAGLRRRRGGLSGFRGHPLFKESLTVFEVWVRATGEFKEALAKWQSGSAPQPLPDAPGPKRRRRRRKGRGRDERAPGQGGHEGGGPEASAPPPPPPSSEA